VSVLAPRDASRSFTPSRGVAATALAPTRRTAPLAHRFAHVGLASILAGLVLVPLVAVAWRALGSPDLLAGAVPDLTRFTTALGSQTLGTALRTTLIFAGGSTLLACLLGGYLAWLTERTDLPLRRTAYVLVLVPLVVPGLLTTVAWTLLLHVRTGLLNRLALALPWVETPPFDAYTLAAMIWVEALDGLTLPFLLFVVALRALDPAYEEASATVGAGPWRTLRRVTLPLLAPALAAAVLLTFVRAVGSFAVPVAMGLPGGVRVLTIEVFLAARRFPSDAELAAAYALLHLAVALVGLMLYRRATRAGAHVTLGGRASPPVRLRLGHVRYLHGAGAALILWVAVVLPVGVMVHGSFVPFTGAAWDTSLNDLTLDHYRWAISSTLVRRALVNNLVVGIGASAATVLLGALVAWFVVRGRTRGRGLLDAVATAPVALPGTVLALALMTVTLRLPFPIYATLWAIGLGYLVAFLPYAVRAAHAALLQVDPVLEEASAMAGAPWSRTFLRIVLPLLAPGLFAGGIYVLSRTFKSLAIPLLLAGPGDEVLPVVVYSLYESARYPALNAVGVLMTLLLVVLVGVARASTRRWRA
jgi:iron(III) transport system permease protein